VSMMVKTWEQVIYDNTCQTCARSDFTTWFAKTPTLHSSPFLLIACEPTGTHVTHPFTSRA